MRRTRQKPNELPRVRCDDLRREVRSTYTREAALAAAVDAGRADSRSARSGLGCGSPTAFAGLAPGEWVLDLGSGAGFDCLAAAVEVGSTGRVVGIDMTPAMVRLARRHAAEAGALTVHFLQAEIESLPFPDETFDVVMSNCVINLCADKERVMKEACRVLKPGGRLAVADIIAVASLPAAVQEDLAFHTGCIAGATPLESLLPALRDAGFVSEQVEVAEHSRFLLGAWAPGSGLERFVAAAHITAKRADCRTHRVKREFPKG